MRKFLEEFDDKNVEDLKREFPAYSSLFDEVLKLEKQSKGDVSRQVSDEFDSVVDSLDNFLFREENLIRLGLEDRTEEKVSLTQTEAISKLEKEIEELTKDVDQSSIDAQIKQDVEKVKKSRLSPEQLERITRDMLDTDQQYFGLKFTQTEFKDGNFNRVLSIMKTGCKFYTGKSGDLTYIMFKLNNTTRLIIEKQNPVIKYNNIFGGQSTPLSVYLVCKEKKNLEEIYQTVRHAFSEGMEGKSAISDDDLFNKPYFVGAFSDIFYEEADLLLQDDYLLERSDNIKQVFSLHFPLQYILTIAFCKAIYDKQSREGEKTYEQIAELIKENIRTKTFRIEGIGDVPHDNNVLEKLKNLNYLDENLNLTGISNSLMFYTGQGHTSGFSVMPDFNAFSYYIDNIKEKFKKSKTKFYSEFNGSPVFHTGETLSKIDYALVLSTKLQNEFGFKDAKQKSAFPNKWQSEQNFKEYSEYTSFSSASSLKFFPRTSEAGKRGLEDIMNFKDEERYDMYFACRENPLFNFAFNSFIYNAILKLNNTKKIRVLGPKATASSVKGPIFFMMVDEKNSLVAVIKPLHSQEKIGRTHSEIQEEKMRIIEKLQKKGIDTTKMEEKRIENLSLPGMPKIGQLDMFVQSNYFSLSTTRNPSAIWEFEKLKEDIKSLATEEVELGVLVSDAGNLTNESEIEEAKEQVNEPDLRSEEEILDADAYDNPEPSSEVVATEEEEMTLEDKIVVMEEHLSTMPEDEDIREELDKLKEELLATKKQKNIEEEEQEIEEEMEEEDLEEEEEKYFEEILDEQIKPIQERQDEEDEEDYEGLFDDDDLEDIEESKEDEDYDYDDLFDID